MVKMTGIMKSAFIMVVLMGTVGVEAEPAVAAVTTPPEIKIDVPVMLKQAKIVFNMDHAAFSGDMAVGIKHMGLVMDRFKQTGAQLGLVAVFHGDLGYLLLNDDAYNANRKTKTGNPYKGLVDNLIKQGAQIEECAITMKANSWGNENLLPGVKVNTGAIGRIVQLVQDGYVMIQP
jgi:intracellular sulfur oxidation DsrE/DsrF family protein